MQCTYLAKSVFFLGDVPAVLFFSGYIILKLCFLNITCVIHSCLLNVINTKRKEKEKGGDVRVPALSRMCENTNSLAGTSETG